MYKASRRREYERVRLMEEELKREKANEEFERKQAEIRRKDEEKTEKNRKKREKRKAGKGKKGAGVAASPSTKKEGGAATAVDGTTTSNGPSRDDNGDRSHTQSEPSNDYTEVPGVIIHEED